ncbi:hypothetical protein VM1G_11664 [Cytospora mali]|uniref:Uncharacterized protein n=1 Tax=Cytospora mali TaxID=578113 RepID=A0A194W2C1_CYTMA|nr:hypothetical protein VM1G_11664 [Valsa mali]
MSYEGACLAAFNDKEECSGATHISRTASAGIRDQLAAIAVAVAVADIAMTEQVLNTPVAVH